VIGSYEAPFELVAVGEEFIGSKPKSGLQLVRIKIAERTRFGEYEIGDMAFARHNFLDTLIDGARADESVCDDRLVLTDAPRPISSLIFNSGIPPTVIQDDVVGVCEIQTSAARLE
jgi:hypothetical protein